MPTPPRRVRRQRRKGQPGMPPGARYCGRPGPFGNPWVVGPGMTAVEAVERYDAWLHGRVRVAPERSVADRRHMLTLICDLHGLDLACWCKLDDPCHVDLLLARANPGMLPTHPWLITIGTQVACAETITVTHAHLEARRRWPGRARSIRRPTPAELAAFREDLDLTQQLQGASAGRRQELLLRPRDGAPVVHEPALFA